MKRMLTVLTMFIAFAACVAEELPEQDYVCHAGEEWIPIRFNTTMVEKGSILDFGSLMNYHKPAGKYGFLKVVGDHFEFEGLPGVPQRFFGVNFSEVTNVLGNYSKEDAAILAEAVARAGYNSVRFHHYDDHLVDKSNGTSTELDLEKIDRFDFLVSELKKRGIYMTIDLYVSRGVTETEIPEIWHPVYNWNYKNAVYLLDSARENLLAFCRNFLNHKNPYTGLTYADEPAFCFVCVLNENGMRHWDPKNNGGLGWKWEGRFNDWCDEFGYAKEERQSAQLRMRFIQHFQNDFFTWLKGELRAMGLKTPLTDENNISSTLAAITTENYDYVDNHTYIGHPKIVDFNGKWTPPVGCDQRSWIEHVSDDLSGMKLFPMRKLNRPFTVTELRWCKPMHSRGEGGVIMGTLAAFQDYSAMYTFQWSWGGKEYLKEAWGGYFDLYGDPIGYTADHIIQLLFMRGDVKPAELTVAMIVPNDAGQLPPAEYTDSFAIPQDNSLFALVAKYGNTFLPVLDNALNYRYLFPQTKEKIVRKLTDGPVGEKGLFDKEAMHFISCTGEMELDCRAKSFRVFTPKSEGLVMIQTGQHRANILNVDNQTPYTTCFASALDDMPLAESRKIIFFHLTNSVHEGMTFGDKSMELLKNYGGYNNPAPHLVLNSVAHVKLELTQEGGIPTVYAISLNGKRLCEVPSVFNDGVLEFTADTAGINGEAAIVYEIAR